MLDFLPSSKTCTGLDIGSHTVKAVQLLKKGSSNPQLISMGIAEINPDIKDKTEAIISAINNALNEFDLRKSRLITSIGGSSMVIKQVSFSTSSPKEIEFYLKLEGSQYIPLPMDKVTLKFQTRYLSSDKKSTEVLLVAVNSELLQNHLNILSQIQLKPDIIDVNPLALANAFLALEHNNNDNNIAIIEIGATTTILNIFKKGGFFFTREISLAGNRFNMEIQNIYNLNFSQAEIYKKEKNIDLDKMKPFFNKLFLEIRQSLLFYDIRTGNKGFERIILTGGGAKLQGFSSYLSENLNLPVTYFNPLKNIKIDEKIAGDDLKDPQIGIAIGLALRE